MKSEHRHELKTNELAQWLANFPQWLKDNTKTLIYLAVLAVVVAGYSFWYSYNKNVVVKGQRAELVKLISSIPPYKIQVLNSQQQGADYSFSFFQIANGLQDLANKTKDKKIAATALIKKGEILRTELRYRLESPSAEDANSQLQNAKQAYLDALNKAPQSRTLLAAAKLGLGLCEEDLGNFDQAKTIYTNLVENQDLQGTVPAVQAKQRLENFSNYLKPVAFKDPPKVEQPIIPQIRLDAPDSNQPVQ